MRRGDEGVPEVVRLVGIALGESGEQLWHEDVGVVVDLGDERGAREPAAGEPEPQREFLAEVVRAAGEGRVQEAHVAAGRGLAPEECRAAATARR